MLADGLLTWRMLEVLRDAALQMQDAKDDGDEEAFRGFEAEWQREARAFLERQRGVKGEPAAKAKARYRTGARAWIVGVDKQLRSTIGSGLRRFVQPVSLEERGNPVSWPVLSVALDQGSDGWSAVMYLQRRANMNLIVMFDPSHRAWNDSKAALQQAGLWSAALLLQITMNLDHGPWRDGKWHSEVVQAAELYAQFKNPDQDAMLISLLEPILRGTGDIDSLSSPTVAFDIAQSLPEHFSSMHPKVSMTRWFGFVDTARAFLPKWHRRLLLQMLLCIETGVFNGDKQSDALGAVSFGGAASSSGERISTARESEEVKKLRLACKNTLELSTLVLGDAHLHRTCMLICAVLEPMREWQSQQSRALRSCPEVLAWYKQAALGHGWASLNAIAKLIEDDGVLADLGVGQLEPQDKLDNLSNISLSVVNEGRTSQATGGLIVALLGARLQTESCYTQGLPLRLAALLDEEAAPRVIADLKRDAEAWAVVKDIKGGFWKKVAARSPFALVFVQQVVEGLRSADWAMTRDLRQVLEGAFAGLGQTKVVEDGFQKERHCEAKNSNRRMALNRIWLSPVDMKVLGDTHRFEEIPFAKEQLPPGVRADDANSLYFSRAKDLSVPVPDLVSKTSATSWYSPAPQMFIGHVADMSLWRYCIQHKQTHLAEKSWLSVLLKGASICVRHTSQKQWFLAVASYSGVAAVGWPMRAVKLGGKTLYGLATDVQWSDTPFLHIISLDEWRAFSFEWAGPLELKISTGARPPQTRLLAVPDGPADSLLNVCAKKVRLKPCAGVKPGLCPMLLQWLGGCAAKPVQRSQVR